MSFAFETLSNVPKNTNLLIFSLKLSIKDTIPDNLAFFSHSDLTISTVSIQF